MNEQNMITQTQFQQSQSKLQTEKAIHKVRHKPTSKQTAVANPLANEAINSEETHLPPIIIPPSPPVPAVAN